MTKFNIFSGSFFILLLMIFAGCSGRKLIQGIVISRSALWTNEQAWIHRGKDLHAGAVIDLHNRQQVIDGFGGCFNEMGWDALMHLDSNARMQVVHDLFDLEDGCRFNICRMPLGANDYAKSWYSYDETPGDYEMRHFSIAHDRQFLIPYIKAARSVSPGLKIWASPWCPPSWMKTNHHYACKMSEVNDLCCKKLEGKEGTTQFIMNDRTLSAYALYFSKFIQAYAGEGIDIYAVHVQNEPNSCQNFPSCIWKASDLTTFIGNYLGPELNHVNLKTEIWYGTIERPFIENIDTVLQNPEARKYIAGIGFQWAGKGAIGAVYKKYPDIKLMQTESECGDGSNDWEAAVHTFGLMEHYLNNGASAYMYWNMVLDESGKSHWGWKQNSLISINRSTKEITRNPEFYLMKLFSSQIDPGAVKISGGNSGSLLVFQNPDGEIILIIANLQDIETSKEIQLGNEILSVDLKPNSISSFSVPAESI